MPTPKDTNQNNEKNEFKKKLEEWKGLGFDTSQLELLFNTDFEKFKKEHKEILRTQLESKKKEITKKVDKKEDTTQEKDGKGVVIAPSEEDNENANSEPSEDEAETIVIASVPEKKDNLDKIEESIDKIGKKDDKTLKTQPKEDKTLANSHVKTDIKDMKESKKETQTKVKKTLDSNLDSKLDGSDSKQSKQSSQKVKKEIKKEKSEKPETPKSDTAKSETKTNSEYDSNSDLNSNTNGISDIEIVGLEKKVKIDKKIKKKISSPGTSLPSLSSDTPDNENEKKKEKKEGLDNSKYDKLPKKGNRTKIAIIALLLSALIFFAFFGVNYFKNTGPKISLSVSNSNPEIGENITINATITPGSAKVVKYTWDFGDGTISRTMHAKAWHTYQNVGKFTITLSIEDEVGLGAKKSIDINVKAEPFTVPPKKYGDKIIYDITTYATLEGANGKPLYQITIPGSGLTQPKTIDILSVTTTGEGTASTEIKRVSDRYDGYGFLHKVYEVYLDQDTSIQGGIQTNAMAEPVPFYGYSRIKESSYCDLSTNTTIQQWSNSSSSATIDEFGQKITPTSTDSLNSYPNMLKFDEQFKPELIYPPDKEFDASNPSTLSGDITCGNAIYHWQMEGAETIAGYPTLKINITLDSNTMALNSMDVFYTTIWICSDFSMPLKSVVHSEGYVEGNYYSATVSLNARSFERGLVDIEWGSCKQNHEWNNFASYFSNYTESFQEFTVVPAAGGYIDSFNGFSPQDAYYYALAQNYSFTSWKSSHPYAYAVDANFSKDAHGHGVWNITFGEAGSSLGYRIFVQRDSAGNFIVEEYSEMPLKDLSVNTNISSLKNRKMLTINSAENILLTRTNAASQTGKLDFTTSWFETSVDLPFPSTDVTSILTRTGKALYGYKLEKKDGTSYGISAENGQLMYIWTHSGQSIGVF